MIRMRFKPLLLLLAILPAFASAEPVCKMRIVVTDKSGIQDTLYAGSNGSTSYEAPLHVKFDAVFDDADAGTQIFCEWRVVRSYDDDGSSMEEDYLTRQEASSEYDVEDDGTFRVSFAYSYREAGSSENTPGAVIQDITFSIDKSDLYVPNAFSPNGDGKNDEFKVRVKSIVSFNMVIFNRWGKVVASGDQNSLRYEAGDDNNGYFICWDGKSGGEVVPDGTYFIHIEAEGAGGRHYTRKSDINILTGLGLEKM